ncbi:response regulator transcription factor [Hyphobacterium sp. CCMP332]|nr:response regulator transcription factor [Hyphobacterium sp. CCMP332]
MDKISCILVEDEEPAIEIFRNFIADHENIECKAHFYDAFKAQSFLIENQVDVIFLDIQLPGITGMEFLKIVKNRPLVVICSAYAEHAIEAFDFEVFDYLLKPYSKVRFANTVQRLLLQLKKASFHQKDSNNSSIEIKSQNRYFKIFPDEINYIESKREKVIFYLNGNREIISRMTMEEVLSIVPVKSFIRIHRSYIVNSTKIHAISANEVSLGNINIPIGRSYNESVKQFWLSRD